MCPPMQGAAPRWYGRNIATPISVGAVPSNASARPPVIARPLLRECPPMWGEGIMPIDCLHVGLDCSHEGAVPKCKNIATPISVGAVPSNASWTAPLKLDGL